jgi:hypothetical protein
MRCKPSESRAHQVPGANEPVTPPASRQTSAAARQVQAPLRLRRGRGEMRQAAQALAYPHGIA